MNNDKVTYKVSFISIVVNIVLSILKIVLGLVSKSKALVSDGIHAASDAVDSIVVIVGTKIANKVSKKHPFGHEKIEAIIALVISFLLLITGLSILIDGINTIRNFSDIEVATPGLISLIIIVVSIISKELLYQYSVKKANEINNNALKAVAWHQRIDSLSSIATLIGIVGARLGYKILDPVAAVIISLLILKEVFELIDNSYNKLRTVNCRVCLNKIISDIVLKNKDIKKVENIDIKFSLGKKIINIDLVINKKLKKEDRSNLLTEIDRVIRKNINNIDSINITLQ